MRLAHPICGTRSAMARQSTQKAATAIAPKRSERAVSPHGPRELPAASSTFANQSWLTQGRPAPTMLQVSTLGTVPVRSTSSPARMCHHTSPSMSGHVARGRTAATKKPLDRRGGRGEASSEHRGESTALEVRAGTTPKYHGRAPFACYRRR